MSKDSYWFKHDSSAGRATRMRKMAFIYSHWGKGIYWDVIEVLRDQEGYRYSSELFDLRMLCDLIGCKDETKFLNWYADCVKFELFIEENGMFFSEVLCGNMKRWEVSKSNGSKGGRPVAEKPKRNQANNQTNNLNNNLNETIREEKRREEKSKKKLTASDDILKQIKPTHSNVFQEWLSYKAEMKDAYKTQTGLKKIITQFNKHSVDCCEWVVNYSIQNEWKGLFWDKYTELSIKPKRPEPKTIRREDFFTQ